MPNIDARPHRLPISRVVVADADCALSRELVLCPRLASSVPVARCGACEHCQSIEPADARGTGAVRCAPPMSEPEPAQSFTLPRLAVADVMTRDVICVRSTLSLDAAALLFLEHAVKTLPVVDRDHQLVGMLYDVDVQLAAQAGRSTDRTVAGAMLPAALMIPESTPVTRAAALMAFEGISCLAVVAPGGEIVGVLSASDLLFWLARADGYLTRVRRSDIP